MFLETALICLAANIYYEARGESLVGQQAVAQVTLNRAGHDPKKVCAVVLKEKQFSWTITKVERDERGRHRVKDVAKPKEPAAWKWSLRVAQRMLSKARGRDVTFGATHYHARYVAPKWAKRMVLTYVEGQHIFYRKG